MLRAHPLTIAVVMLLADKWTIPVIHALAGGVMRTGELKRDVDGISQKMLTTLRTLEAHGLVDRTVFPMVPVRVEYRLTELGESIIDPIATLCRWTQRHGPTLERIMAKHPVSRRR